MKALEWALGLGNQDPKVKLLAIYIATLHYKGARYINVDLDKAGDFCCMRWSSVTIMSYLRQLPNIVCSHDRQKSRVVRVDFSAVPGCEV